MFHFTADQEEGNLSDEQPAHNVAEEEGEKEK